MKDHDINIADQIAATTAELDAAREVVRTLANDLADVSEVLEPVLMDHVKKIRAARMAGLEELRMLSAGITELRTVLLAKDTAQMLTVMERFLTVCREMEEFRAVGFLDAFVKLMAESR